MESLLSTSTPRRKMKCTNQKSRWTLLQNAESVATILCGLLTFGAWLFESSLGPVSIILYLSAFVIGGYVKAKEGIVTLVRDKDLDVNLLMIIAAIGAACIGYWLEGAILIFIFSLSGTLETYTMKRSSREISSLMSLKPEQAILYEGGRERTVAVEALKPGDVIIVKAGEYIPADGVVHSGSSTVNQASITGESVPIDKSVGDEVFAGTQNLNGALFVEVSKTSEATLFSKIIRLVQEAQSEMPKSQVFMEHFERIYARSVLALTVALIFAGHYLIGWSWNETLYKSIVFLVVASPCALVASIMPAMLSAISNGARKGLLLKGGAHLENLSHVNVLAFDKTGTLTYGSPSVTDLIPFHDVSEQQLLYIAASIEALSTHPIAKAIVREANQKGITLSTPTDFVSLTGWGVQGQIDGTLWKIGKPEAANQHKLDNEMVETLNRLRTEGKTIVLIENEEMVAGVIAVQDQVRPQVKRMITALKPLGIKTVMLTGDHQMTAKGIATEVGIDDCYAELLPEDKLKKIQELKQKGYRVAMVGDGVNDAPALATSSVGIAMGGIGSDSALETADLVLMNDDLERILDGIILGRRMKRVIWQNMIFSALVILTLMLSNFTTGIPLPLGVIGHEGSTILVILNGLRLLR